MCDLCNIGMGLPHGVARAVLSGCHERDGDTHMVYTCEVMRFDYHASRMCGVLVAPISWRSPCRTRVVVEPGLSQEQERIREWEEQRQVWVYWKKLLK